jgi:hypothetical protein
MADQVVDLVWGKMGGIPGVMQAIADKQSPVQVRVADRQR